MKPAHLRQSLAELGAKPEHIDRILRAWIQCRSLDNRHSKAENFLPQKVRDALPVLLEQLKSLAQVRAEHVGEDSSTRLLVSLPDAQTVESVLLPRDGLCISTQVGCAVGCRFCMTGRSGLLRQVSSTEMVAQLVLARQRRRVSRVVFMGMGEPSHNIDNVIEAIQLMGTYGNIGHKNLVFSTVGDLRVFDRLPKETVKPALAISLHSTDATRRADLMPNAPRIPPEELVALAEDYARRTGYPIQYQWTLLAGINDSEADMDGIVRLLSGKYAVMNLIPYNTVDALPYQRPAREHAEHLIRYLMRHRVLAKLRNSAGQDVDGGCGQLRARSIAITAI